MSSKLAEAEELEVGKTYEIVEVQPVTTDIRGFRGFRLIAKDTKTNKTKTTMLWERPIVGTKSKLGAFYKAFKDELGNDYTDTTKWTGRQFTVLNWVERNREIKLVGKKAK